MTRLPTLNLPANHDDFAIGRFTDNTDGMASGVLYPPRRIQRKRTKGWRMPPNTIYVGRGSKWGNRWFIDNGIIKYKAPNGQIWLEGAGDINAVIAVYEEWLLRQIRAGHLDLTELHNSNVACWCRLDHPCHGDPLLRHANERRNT